MPIGCYGADVLRGQLKQHAIKEVANILLSHGKAGLGDQLAQLGLGQREGGFCRPLFKGRKLRCR